MPVENVMLRSDSGSGCISQVYYKKSEKGEKLYTIPKGYSIENVFKSDIEVSYAEKNALDDQLKRDNG